MPSMPWVGVWTTVTSRAVSCAATQARSSSGEPTSRWLLDPQGRRHRRRAKARATASRVAVLEVSARLPGTASCSRYRVRRQRCRPPWPQPAAPRIRSTTSSAASRACSAVSRDHHRDRLADEPHPLARPAPASARSDAARRRRPSVPRRSGSGLNPAASTSVRGEDGDDAVAARAASRSSDRMRAWARSERTIAACNWPGQVDVGGEPALPVIRRRSS